VYGHNQSSIFRSGPDKREALIPQSAQLVQFRRVKSSWFSLKIPWLSKKTPDLLLSATKESSRGGVLPIEAMTNIEVTYTLRVPGRPLDAAYDEAIAFIKKQISTPGDTDQPEVTSFKLSAVEVDA
jgi:hypothetical protein